MPADLSRFKDLSFGGFRELARDQALSPNEKVGFPDSYRAGKEEAILKDIISKLPSLQRPGSRVIDIGCGCSNLPVLLAMHCSTIKGCGLVLMDSQEMLDLVPTYSAVEKWPGRFPLDLMGNWPTLRGSFDTVIVYSVIQYVFAEDNLWNFLDRSLDLLKDGGELLLGDVPNVSMRKRFFSSESGYETHRAYVGRDERPTVQFNVPEPQHIDDSVVLGLLARARSQGFHGWVVPQADGLPMANRREDMLFRKP